MQTSVYVNKGFGKVHLYLNDSLTNTQTFRTTKQRQAIVSTLIDTFKGVKSFGNIYIKIRHVDAFKTYDRITIEKPVHIPVMKPITKRKTNESWYKGEYSNSRYSHE